MWHCALHRLLAWYCAAPVLLTMFCVLQLEGLSYFIRGLANLQLTPDLETPRYTVLKRKAEYEVRKYDPYIVAEVPMPSASGPSAGDGFNDLARYIFGGNDR